MARFEKPLFTGIPDIDSCAFLITESKGQLFKTRSFWPGENMTDIKYKGHKRLYVIRVKMKPFMVTGADGKRLCA